MAVKKGIREIRNEENALAIQQNAQMLFDQYGFDRVTIADICEASNVSKSTFYNLYQSKDDLLMVAHLSLRSDYIKAHYTFDDLIPLHELFRRFFRTNFEYAISMGREQTRRMYQSYLKTGEYIPIQREKNQYIEEMYRLIERGKREKLFYIDLPDSHLFDMMTDTMVGLFIGWSIYPTHDETKIAEQYFILLDRLVDSYVKKE